MAGSDARPSSPVERFDFDDVSAQAGQQLRGVGECLHLLDGEHADSLKGAPRGCGLLPPLPQRTPF